MRGSFSNSVYVSAALAIIGAVGLWLYTPNASRPAEGTAATGQTTQINAAVDGSAFRYGPEINHGRSDTPVTASAQALREARATAPYSGERRTGDQAGAARGSGTVTFFSRGLSSGH